MLRCPTKQESEENRYIFWRGIFLSRNKTYLEEPADTNNKKELCEKVKINLKWKFVNVMAITPIFWNSEIPGSAACFCYRQAVFQSVGWMSHKRRDSPAPREAPG